MKVFLTGGDGFIGRYVIQNLGLMGADYHVGVIEKTQRIPRDRQTVIDILDEKSIENALLSYKPDVIIHLAAIANVMYGDISKLYSVNVKGTENLFVAAQNVCSEGTVIALASSAGVYGNQEYKYIPETADYNPMNHYSFTKMVCEFLSRQYRDYFDIRIIRPFTVVGPYQTTNFFVSKMVDAFVRRQPIIEVGNLESVRDYTDVELCGRAIAEFATRRSVDFNILNICTGIGSSCNDVIRILKEKTGYEPQIVVNDQFVRKNEIWRMVGDYSRIKNLLGEKFIFRSIDEIISDMLKG